jgi:hypothetical protein
VFERLVEKGMVGERHDAIRGCWGQEEASELLYLVKLQPCSSFDFKFRIRFKPNPLRKPIFTERERLNLPVKSCR